jgi:hypothetical protein
MDHLNKQQIVLVVLLASFVTAITTGIVAVSLTDKADPGVVNTVNKVVERTVEKIIPTSTTTVIKTENRTLVVGVDEVLANSVEKASASLARVYEESLGISTFTGIGIVLDKSGSVFVDKRINEVLTAEGSKYKIIYSDKTSTPAKIIKDNGKGWLILSPIDTASSSKVYTPANISNSDSIKLAQSAIIFTGEDNNIIYSSLIQSIVPNNDASSTIKNHSFAVGTEERKTVAGSLAINLNGEVIGYKSAIEGKELNYFKSINLIKDFIKN